MNPPLAEPKSATLCDALDRLLNTGVSVYGDITISVAEVDLLTISLRGLIAAVDAVARSQSDQILNRVTRSETSDQPND